MSLTRVWGTRLCVKVFNFKLRLDRPRTAVFSSSPTSGGGINSNQQHINQHEAETLDGNHMEDDLSAGIYPGHHPTTCTQKVLLALGSGAMSLAAPWRDDMISIFGEVTGPPSLRYMRRKMLNDPVGRQILEERPCINTDTVDLQYLSTLPQGTFGREYSNFLRTYKYSPDDRMQVRFVDDPDLAYVMQRYREVHDLLHTILGMPTHMLGEVVVKWVEGLQFALPLGLTGGLFGAIRLGPKHRQHYLNTHLWWAVETGLNARFLMNVYYEDHWDWSMEEFRNHLNIKEPPLTPTKKRVADPEEV